MQNKDKLSIGAKLLTYKERVKQTKCWRLYKQISRQKEGKTEKKRKSVQLSTTIIQDENIESLRE